MFLIDGVLDDWIIERFRAELDALPEYREPRWLSASALDSHADLPLAPVLDAPVWKLPVIDWHARAACAGMGWESFFGDDQVERQPSLRPTVVKETRKVCFSCPVQLDCFTWALEHAETHGIWGGASGKQRNKWFAALRLVPAADRPAVIERVAQQWLTSQP